MIRRTLAGVQEATFCVMLPGAGHGLPSPIGTGFFVSADGWFVTAAHVVTEDNRADGRARSDVGDGWLLKESVRFGAPRPMVQNLRLDWVDAATDLAILRADFAPNAAKEWLKGRSGFPWIQISSRQLDVGEPVYAFGYPLSHMVVGQRPDIVIGEYKLSPRVTSAIVSADIEATKMATTNADVRMYVLDKALNYGNSGGPIIASETGNVHAVCRQFQPLLVRQEHLEQPGGAQIWVFMPSLYGVTSSLANPLILAELAARGVSVVTT